MEGPAENDRTILLTIITNLFNILKKVQNSNNDTNVKNVIINFNQNLEESDKEVWQRFLVLDVWDKSVAGSRETLNRKSVLGLLFNVKQTIQNMKAIEDMSQIGELISKSIKELSTGNQEIWQDFLAFNSLIISTS